MNNRERLANMSDEKLAAWLWNHVDFTTFCNELCPFMTATLCRKRPTVDSCADGMLEWLWQEHKGAE
jgi:hypothetical protein